MKEYIVSADYSNGKGLVLLVEKVLNENTGSYEFIVMDEKQI